MKKFWKILLGIGAVIAGILAMSSKGSKKQFKKDLKDNKKKLLTVPFNEKPISALAAYFQTDDGIEIMEMLDKKLK